MKKLFFITLSLIFAVSCGKDDPQQASKKEEQEVRFSVPSIFSDNMVLQRNSSVNVWGTAPQGSSVSMSASWGEDVSAVADNAGNWSLSLRTPDAGGPYNLSIECGKYRKSVSGVMCGEVWYCSGQSNMEMPVCGWTDQPVLYSDAVLDETSPDIPIRMCKVNCAYSLKEETSCNATWYMNDRSAVSGFSALAYFFAKKLYEELNVPIGVVVAACGGTSIISWIDRDTHKELNLCDLTVLDNAKKADTNMPCTLCNAMYLPIKKYTFKGAIWYQGENDRNSPDSYVKLQKAYVGMLRKNAGNPDMPFYFVQIAPYKYDNPVSFTSGYFYEAQCRLMKEVPHCGMATSVDTGEADCIHPSDKRKVSERLANLALVNDYGYEGTDPYPPVYSSCEFIGAKALVKFDVGASGLSPVGEILDGFEMAMNRIDFFPATAKVIMGESGKYDTIEVSSPQVMAPMSVRYAFRNVASAASLFNGDGVAASPFRTDTWNVVQ